MIPLVLSFPAGTKYRDEGRRDEETRAGLMYGMDANAGVDVWG